MPTTHAPSLAALRRAIQLSEEIQRLEEELKAIFTGSSTSPVDLPAETLTEPTKKTRGRKRMSAETRAKMAAAQQAGHAKKGEAPKANGKQAFSPEHRAKLAAAQQARFAKKAKGGKRTLSPEGRARIVAALKARHAASKRKKQK